MSSVPNSPDNLTWGSHIRPLTRTINLESGGNMMKYFFEKPKEDPNNSVKYPRCHWSHHFLYRSMMHMPNLQTRPTPMDWSQWLLPNSEDYSENIDKAKSIELQSEYEKKKIDLLEWKEKHNEWKQKCRELENEIVLLTERMQNEKTEELKSKLNNASHVWRLWLYNEPDHLEHCDCWECYKTKNNSW